MRNARSEDRLSSRRVAVQATKLFLIVGAIAAAYWIGGFGAAWDGPSGRKDMGRPIVSDLPALLALPVAVLHDLDIARMNLLCAEGLPGSEKLDVAASLARLDAMAMRVRTETERHFHRFQQNPAEFEHSEGFYRMLMLAVVLAEDFQVHYSPNKISNAAGARLGDGFFTDSRDVFLHGLTGPRPQGTCSSLPVLQVAIGRRLGYPLKLVTTKGHLFVRWEDARERFNVEAAGNGVNRFSDDYYRRWPLEVSEEEVHAEGYLKSLSPVEELAVFLSIRAMCLNETKRYADAAAAFQAATRLAACQSYGLMQAEMERMAGRERNRQFTVTKPGESNP